MVRDDPAGAFEVVQTRELTRAEARKIDSAAWRVSSPYRYYASEAAFWVSSAGILLTVVAFILFLNRAAPLGVSYPLWGVLGFVVGGLSFLLSLIIAEPLTADVRRQRFRSGTRYTIRSNGLVVIVNDIRTFYPWRSLQRLCLVGPYFLAYLSGLDAIILVRAAFEHQDIDGFCAELQRRWQDHRTAGRAATRPAALRGQDLVSDDAAATVKVVQTRELTRAEAAKMAPTIGRVGSPYRYYAHAAALFVSSAGFALAVLAIDVKHAALLGVEFPLWGTLAFVVGTLSFLLRWVMPARFMVDLRRQRFRPGNCCMIRSDGLETTRNDIQTFYPWHSLHRLCSVGPYFLAYLSGVGAFVLVKPAHERQDIDGFCTELQRSWQDQQDRAQTARP